VSGRGCRQSGKGVNGAVGSGQQEIVKQIIR